MKAIRIVKCSDSMMWYRNKVGHIVEYLREDDQYLWSREPAGYSNIIRREDGEVTECALNDAQLSWICNFIKTTNCNGVARTTYDNGMVEGTKEILVRELRKAHGQTV